MNPEPPPSPSAAASPDKRLAVVVADSGLLVLHGIEALLADRVDVVTTAPSYESLHAAVDQHRPDVAVVELTLLYEADAGAFGALGDLATRVAVVVTGDEIFPADLVRIFGAGAQGVVLKDDRPAKLLEAVTVVKDPRQRYIDPRLAPDLLDEASKWKRGRRRPFGLTAQQLRVVRLIADEHPNAEIARRLGISVDTVKSHIRDAVPKLGAYDRTHAARIAAAHEEIRQVDPGDGAEHLHGKNARETGTQGGVP